jgi:hypothetical protein
VVYTFDLQKRTSQIAVDISALKPVTSSPIKIGVNGVHVVGGYLYFSNSDQGLVGRVAVDFETGHPREPVEVLAMNIQTDDFAVGRGGVLWLAASRINSIVRVLPGGSAQSIVGAVNSTALLGPTAVAFGRNKSKAVLYVTTTGNEFNQQTGELLRSAGQIAKIDIAGCGFD